MNLRLLMRKFVRIVLCCVTLLELVDRNTFGFNKGSLQQQDSKRSSSFYKVEEGMFKKFKKKCRFVSCNLLVLDKKYTHFAYQVKSRENFTLHLATQVAS